MMIVYLLKSALCLMVLLLIHRLILQREAMHQFNRFFLLMAVVGSFLIPLIAIEVAPEAIMPVDELSQVEIQAPDFSQTYSPIEVSEVVEKADIAEKPIDWQMLLWAVYSLVSLVFLIRFIRNINLLRDKINRNFHLQYKGETLVLIEEETLPFSFLSYIFVSKQYFETEKLTDAIFAHEQAHVHGKHSWDILFIEAMLVPFWFHPGLYFASKAIKLNHEFIADQAALGTTPLENYKSLLLSMMLPDQKFGLASSLNFSLTKKRFEMLRRNTANSTKWIKILSVIPVLAVLVYFFSEKVVADQEAKVIPGTLTITTAGTPQDSLDLNLKLDMDGNMELDGKQINLEQLNVLIKETETKNLQIYLEVDPKTDMGMVADVQEILRENDIRRVVYKSQTTEEYGSIRYPIPTNPEYRQASLSAFGKLNGVYLVKMNRGGLFQNKTSKEIEELLVLYNSLQEKYSDLSYEDKRIIQRPIFPYARLEQDGKLIFKRFEYLTEEERKTLGC